MQVEHLPNEVSPEESEQVEVLKRKLEAVLLNGKSHDELDHIENIALANKSDLQKNCNCTGNLSSTK